MYAVLFYAYGWDRDTVDRLTVRQAELWCMKAVEQLDRDREIAAYHMREVVVDVLVATGLVKRT